MPPPQKTSTQKQAHLDRLAYLRARADALFEAMDADASGAVDREEFIAAMDLLKSDLGWSEAELGAVFSAIDCHGHVTREQVRGGRGGVEGCGVVWCGGEWLAALQTPKSTAPLSSNLAPTSPITPLHNQSRHHHPINHAIIM